MQAVIPCPGSISTPGARLAAAVATAVALACLPASAQAQRMTGNELWTYCTANDTNSQYFNPLSAGICAGFVEAIADAVATDGVYGWRACFPAGSTRGQLTDVVKRYLDQHPEKRHYLAASIAAEALAQAFPCQP